MSKFVLNARILSEDENLILFGNLNGVKALKVLDIENYFDLLKALYKNDEICLPDNFKYSEDILSEYIYIYCDMPIGSRYFYERNGRFYTDTKTKRESVYNFPIQYVKSEITSLCYPFIEKWMNTVDKSITKNLDSKTDYFNFIGATKDNVSDIFLSGLVLTSFKQKIVSCVSFSTLQSHFSSFETSVNLFSKEELIKGYMFTATFMPKELTDCLDISLSEEEISNFSVGKYKDLTNPLVAWYKSIANLTTWQNNSDTGINIVIGPSFFKLNGLVEKEKELYLALDKNSQVISQIAGKEYNPGNILTAGFVGFFTSQIQIKGEQKEVYRTPAAFKYISLLSGVGQNAKHYSGGRYNTNFVFVNKDKVSDLSTHSLGLPEYFTLDEEFMSAVSDGFKEVIIANHEEKRPMDDAIKAQFSLKKEIYLSEEEAANPRYDVIKNKDQKLFLLIKTSKTREALKKAAITRKITASMSSLVSLSLRVYAADDLTLGFTEQKDKHYAFGVLSNKTFFNDGDLNLDIAKQRDAYIKEINSEKTKVEEFVATLYKAINLSVSCPFTELIKPAYLPEYQSYSDYFNKLQKPEQLKRAFSYLWREVRDISCRNIYSPSSNSLDFISLASGIYKFVNSCNLPAENKYLQGRYADNGLSGKQAHYFYTSNFIDSDPEFSQSIENYREKDHIYVSSNTVLASSCFNWSQDALDVFAALKKCKTFTDYYNWYLEANIALKQRIKKIFEVEDIRLYNVLIGYVDSFLAILSVLKDKETPYLSVPVKKERKKKETVEETEVLVEASLAEAVKKPLSSEELVKLCMGDKYVQPNTRNNVP